MNVLSAYGTPRPSEFTRLNMRLWSGVARRRLAKHPQLGVKLAKARHPLVPWAYLCNVYGYVTIAVLLGSLPLVVVLPAAQGALAGSTFASLVLLPVLLGMMVYSYAMLRPDLDINARRQNLESNLPYALNFMAVLSSAGVLPEEAFGALGKQAVYGEVSRESMWIYRDTKVLSKDLVGAIQAAARRSPSPLWEEFLHGSVSTVTSGGHLATYFMAKAEQYSQENRRKQKGFLESMGVMAESYVVVAAAAPLFLIVILSVMMLLSKQGNPVLLLNALVLVMLPIIHIAFTWILRTMRAD